MWLPCIFTRCQNLTIGWDYNNNLSATLLSHSIRPFSHYIIDFKCTQPPHIWINRLNWPQNFVGTKESPRIPSHLIYFQQASIGAPSHHCTPPITACLMFPGAPRHHFTPPLHHTWSWHQCLQRHQSTYITHTLTEKHPAGSHLQDTAPRNIRCIKTRNGRSQNVAFCL